MAKLTLADITDTPGFDVTVNDNWRLIEQALENTHSRDGTSPNQMEFPIDANSERLNNLADGIDQQDAVTIAQLINASIAGPVSIGALIDVDLTGINVNDILQWDGIQFLPVPLVIPVPATETVQGIAELATQGETDAGTDDERIVTPLKLGNLPQLQQATTTSLGIAEIATQSQTNNGTNDDVIVTPLKLEGRTATTGRSGVVELATQAEVDAGTDTDRAVTPATLAASPAGSRSFSGVVATRATDHVASHTTATPPTGETAIPFTGETIDTGVADYGTEFHSTSGNITRLTVPAGVSRVRLRGTVEWVTSPPSNQNGTGLWHLRIRKNGNSFGSIDPGMAAYIPWITSAFFGSPQEHGHQVESVVINVSPGDYFELMVQSQGSAFSGLIIKGGTMAFEMEVME